jgi:MFS family permease
MEAATSPVSYRALFRVPRFARLALATFFVRTGQAMAQLGLVLFVLQRFGAPEVAGLTVFLAAAPGIAISPLAGALLDRFGRIRLMALDYTVSALTLAAVVLLDRAGGLTLPLLFVLVALNSLTNPLGTVGGRTMFPLVVPRALWDRANAVDSMGYTFTTLVGPPFAGAIVALGGATSALAVTALVLFAGAATIIGMPDVRAVGAADTHLLAEARAGVVYVVRHPVLRALAVGISVNNLGHGILIVGLPVLVLQRLGGDAALVGQLWAAMGGAGVLSALVVGRWGTEGRERRILALGMLGGAVGLAVIATASALPAVVVGVLVLGLTSGPVDVSMFSLRARVTDPARFGRAFAVSMHLNYLGLPVGSALSGPLLALSVPLAFGLSVFFPVLGAALSLAMIPPSVPSERERASA